MQTDRGSSAPNVTMQKTRGELVQESFDRILDILQQLSLYQKSPKLFIIYAHDNEKSGFKAYQEVVKKYISWFKKIRFNIDSDKSPHGYGNDHEVGHPGASNDIFLNQVCLLPKRWHKKNVDYVLIFYSEVLASYMKNERDFKHENKTYSDAVIETCQKLQDGFQDHSQDGAWDTVCNKIRAVQQKYSKAMEKSFHHVLTETALLSFTNQCGAIDKTIPIMLYGDENWNPDLKWQPHFVHNRDTQIRISIKPEEEYRQFFKILLEFETLERDRPLIDVMIKCFEDSVKLLEGNPQPETYRNQLELFILKALRNLSHQWQEIKRPITRADIRSRLDLYSKLDCESLRRLSGDRLLGNFNDIELAVTERLDSEGEGPMEGQQEGREVVGQQREREIVPLHGLFDERKAGKETIRPQRILIQGRPGIGKTTLCRRLMYEYSWHAKLRTKFHLVVRIPVGKLAYSADLTNLLFEEYFQAVSEGRDLSKKLGSLILDHGNANLESKNASSVNILIILDGLDESRGWSHEKRALLEKLMGRPAVIITSRSHDTDMLHKSIYLHLEALGLSMMSVNAYLDNKEIVPSDTATEIYRFIESKPFVRDMVRVPIHLDILCYSWDELHGKNAPTKFINELDEGENVSLSITALYQAVVCSLWRKDIPELGKLDHGEPVTVEVTNAVQNSARLERLVNTESNFLEELANQMMESDRLEFTNKDIAEAIQRTESNDNLLPLSLERNLAKLSLLRSYPSEGHRKYRFVHLTFQEFFAARYLARHVAHNGASFETLLRQHKYNRRYEIVWMFLTGLLSTVEELDFFFNLLDDEPRDLVGMQHIQLLMYCLSECQIRMRPSRWSEYQEKLEDWLRLEVSFSKDDGIGSSIAFPENILRKQLPSNAALTLSDQMPWLMRTILHRNSLSENLIQDMNRLTANKHDNIFLGILTSDHIYVSKEFFDTVNFTTMWILKQKARLPEATIFEFIEKLRLATKEDNDAFLVLMRQPHLPDAAIKKLVQWLEDPRLYKYADQILGNQATLPKETIENAIEKLIDQGSHKTFRFFGQSSVYLRQDLHAEAIAKIWDCLEKAASRNERISPAFLFNVSRIHLLQPDDVERFGKYLETPSYTLQTFAAEVLRQQPSLPTHVLNKFVEMMRNGNRELFEKAQQILQKQSNLLPEIIDELRDLFEKDKHKVVAVLKERLRLPGEAYDWLMAQIPERENDPIKYNMAVDHLLGQSDLPDYLVNSLPELIGKGVASWLVAELLGRQKSPSNEAVNRLLKVISPLDYSYRWDSRTPAIINQAAFAEPLITTLEEATSTKKAENVALFLRHTTLDEELVQRLRSLLIPKPTPALRAIKSKTAFKCLAQQGKLDRKTILHLHDTIRKIDGQLSRYPIWKSRHTEQFYANLAVFDSKTIHSILSVFFRRPVENLAPAYINGKTLYFYAEDRKLIEQTLEDEKAFRENFREAQRTRNYPEWAWMKPPKEKEKKNPGPASRSWIYNSSVAFWCRAKMRTNQSVE